MVGFKIRSGSNSGSAGSSSFILFVESNQSSICKALSAPRTTESTAAWFKTACLQKYARVLSIGYNCKPPLTPAKTKNNRINGAIIFNAKWILNFIKCWKESVWFVRSHTYVFFIVMCRCASRAFCNAHQAILTPDNWLIQLIHMLFTSQAIYTMKLRTFFCFWWDVFSFYGSQPAMVCSFKIERAHLWIVF